MQKLPHKYIRNTFMTKNINVIIYYMYLATLAKLHPEPNTTPPSLHSRI